MQYHAITCNTMQYHAIQCNTMKCNEIPCNTIQNRAIPCNTMQYHGIPCNTMQYHAIPCNTMQYHAILCKNGKNGAGSKGSLQTNTAAFSNISSKIGENTRTIIPLIGWDSENEVWSRFVFEHVIWHIRILWQAKLSPHGCCALGNVFRLTMFRRK